MALACGNQSIFIINENRELFSWGRNVNMGLGLFDRESHEPTELSIVPTPTRVVAVQGNVKMVMANSSRAACVTHDGDVFVWGKPNMTRFMHTLSADDALLSPSANSYNTPRKVDRSYFGGAKAVQAACSLLHTLVLTDTGELFEATLVESDCKSGRMNSVKHFHVEVGPLPGFFSQERVRMIATGMEHAVAIGEYTGLWSWGNGYAGQLGHGDDWPHMQPTFVIALAHHLIDYVACGSQSTFAICSDSQADLDGVYTWGSFIFGQNIGVAMPHIHTPSRMHPDLFENQSIIMLAPSEQFLLALSVCGTLWSCGNRELLLDEFSFHENYAGAEPGHGDSESDDGTVEYNMPDVAPNDVEMQDQSAGVPVPLDMPQSPVYYDMPQSPVPNEYADATMHEESDTQSTDDSHINSFLSDDDGFQPASPRQPTASIHVIPQKIAAALFHNARLVFVAASRSNFAVVTELGKLYVCNLLHNMPHPGVPMFFHPAVSSTGQVVYSGALAPQPYFGGSRVFIQHRLSVLHAAQYALGYYQNNRDFYTHMQHRRMLRLRKARIAATAAAHNALVHENTPGAASSASLRGPFRQPPPYQPLRVLYHAKCDYSVR